MEPLKPITQPLGRTVHLPSFQIGPVAIAPYLVLAPMEGHTNYALRSLVRDFGGCGLVFTEFISAEMLLRGPDTVVARQHNDWSADEYPIAVQLFGSDPGRMAEAAALVASRGASIVDINMGCWVPKIVRSGAGAGLLLNPDRARQMMQAVVDAVDVPVTIKTRSGLTGDALTAPYLAEMAAESGVRGVTVHARLACDGHAGAPDWEAIRATKAAVPELPIIGNGGVIGGPDARKLLEQTGADGVMIGRAILGQPWLLRDVAAYLRTGVMPEPPSRPQRAAIALEHAYRTLERRVSPEERAIRELRGQLSLYDLDLPGEHSVRDRLVRLETVHDMEAVLRPIAQSEVPSPHAPIPEGVLLWSH
jgi:tRNA-dihydrouridine synthase B